MYQYRKGEVKTRPGVFFMRENRGGDRVAGALIGVCSIAIKADYGPLNKVIMLSSSEAESVRDLFGAGSGTAAVMELFNGGATTAQIVRVGTGGTESTLTLNDTAETPAPVVTVTALYPGEKTFKATVREKIGDATKKEFLVYDGNTLLETLEFLVGDNEPQAFADVVNQSSNYVTATKTGDGNGTLGIITQVEITGGTAVTVTNEDYSKAFNLLEPYEWNTISCDSNDAAVHALLAAYQKRVYQSGKLAFCVVGEPLSVPFEDRLAHAKAFNDENIVYMGDGWINSAGETIDGFLAVSRVAGYIAATPSSQSIVHLAIDGAVDLADRLTNDQYVQAIHSGMLMLSASPDKTIWFDSGVTTLVVPGADQDEGWKKIKRTAVRNELMNRIDKTVAKKAGKVNVDPDGLADVTQAGQNVINTMIAEGGKILTGGLFYPDQNLPAQGDSAWFVIDVDDVDAMEKIYLRYRFRYSPLS